MWTLLVGVFVLWAPRRPRLAQVAFLLVAGFCALGVSFPPQAALWLLPLAALAVPRWRDQVLWWVAEAAYFGAVWLYIAGQSTTDRALPPELYAMFLLLRLAGIAWLVVCVVREARDASTDAVRATGSWTTRPAGTSTGRPTRWSCASPEPPGRAQARPRPRGAVDGPGARRTRAAGWAPGGR